MGLQIADNDSFERPLQILPEGISHYSEQSVSEPQQLKKHEHERIFGSTGILSLNEHNIVRRSLMWAQFRNGEVNSVPIIFNPAE